MYRAIYWTPVLRCYPYVKLNDANYNPLLTIAISESNYGLEERKSDTATIYT